MVSKDGFAFHRDEQTSKTGMFGRGAGSISVITDSSRGICFLRRIDLSNSFFFNSLMQKAFGDAYPGWSHLIGFVFVVDVIQIIHGIKAESDAAASLLEHVYLEN